MDKSQSNNGKDLALKNAPLLSLMKRCGQNLGDILSGKLDSREIMFPGGDFSAVEKVYQDTPQSRYYNDIMAAVIKSLVNALPLDRELRILEVGAGTGGSSSAILSHLPAHQCSYFFTDISTLFLNRAKERFEHYKFIEYRTLDINKNTEKQGFSLHDFDLIVASNVLHAASDLKNSLRRLKSLLTSNGLLVLREITESSPVLGFEITFGGLLEPLSDLSFRNNHPFLDCAQWGELLQNEGFDRIQSFPDPSDIAFDEHIVVARLAALPEVAGAFRPRAVKRSDLIKSSYIHPLLGQRLNSPLETAQYQAIVGVDRQNYLAQHKVFDLVIAPGTAHFEIAAAAGLDFFACQEIAIENTILREALILSEGDRIVQVVLTPSDDTAEFQIFSQSSKEGAKGSWRLHVEGALKPVSGRIKEKTDLDELKKLYLEKVDVASYYQKFNDYGAVNYGPAFQGIRTLFRRQGGALAQVSLDNAVALSANLYNIHPALLDSCLQCIVAALITDQNQLTGDGYMPFSVDEVIFHSKAQQTVWCHAQMKEGDSFNQEMFSASFWLYDPEGRLIAEIINLNMKRTNRETLELLKGSQNNFNDVLYDTIWRQIEEPVKKESLGGSWLILADNNEETAIELVEELKSANRSAKIISFQNEDQNSDWPDEHVIDPKKPEDFIKLIENWRSTQANCAVVAYLYSLDSYETDLQSSRGLESFKRRVVGGFLHLTQALAKSSLKEVRLVILTRGAQNTRASEIIAPNQSVLWGLEKCVANELSELQPMIIDLDPVNDSSNDMALILSLIESSSFKEDKIALRGGKLLAPRLIQAQAPALSDKKYLSIPEGAEGFALDASKVGIENLCLKPLLRSEPRLGEIEIEVEAVGLNFKDVMIAMGLTAHRDGSIGTDCSGRVSKIGAQVTNFQVGDRVFATAYGAFASHVVTPATSAAKMPQDLSFTDAAAIPTVFMTAWYTLVDRGRVEKSSKVLLHSAAGGVGLAAIQVAKGAGAEIYATAGTARKRSLLKSLGVKKVYSSRSPKYADLLLKDTGGEGVDIVLNFLTGQAADAGLRALKSGGRFIEIGRTNVRTPEQIAAIRSDIEYCVIDLERMGYEESDKLIAIFRSVMDGFEKGVFKPIRKRVFSMENCIEAFRYMMEARHIGKVVVKRSFRPTSGSIRQDCFYLITGGLSELALALAEHLANKGAKKLILLARREAKDQEIEAISALKTKGVEIVTLKADLTNRESLETIWRERVLNLGAPLAGIYHLAGLLDDDLIINLNWERFDKVMAPKLDGAWFLHELTCDIDLDYFVMYSSMASIMGTHGQSNYAAANTFLDALAAYRRSDFLPAFSVNWGAWNSIGAVNRMGIMERIRRQGVEGFEPKTALAILDRLVAGRDSQRAVMKIDWNRMLPIISAGAGASFFSELKAKKPSIGAKAAIESSDSALAEKLRAMPMDKRVSALRQYLKKEIASFLHIDKDTIPDEAELVNLGMDSLVSLDLFQRIGKDLKIRIAPREIAANPNVAAMSEKFASDLGPDASQGPKETKAQSSVFSSLGDIFIADSEKAHEPFPLSDMQQAYWLGHNSSSMALSGVSCHFYFEAEAEGLDLDRYQRAWNVLINRHDMLRTVIMDGENQIVLKEFSPYQIKRHELSSLSPYDQKKRLLEIRHSLSHEIIKVDSWPNFRVEASIVGANLIRLHFSFDLIISDFHGISLMMKELEKVYAGNEESLAKLELTFRDYRLAEERYRLTQPFLDDKAYWLKRIETLPAAPKLPLALNPDNIIKPRFTRQRARLKAQTWQNLKDMSAKRNFTPTAVTLAAFAQTLARFSESPNFTLNLTLFNRLPVHSGVDSIVGEFTSNSLLEVDLSQSNNFESRAGQVWNQLWSDLEHRSFSGVRVLREMSRQRGLKASLMPVVFTSALTLDSSFTAFAMGGLGREIYSLSQTPQVWLDHQLFEIESELHLIIDSVEGLFPEGLLEDMFSSYAELLEDLASNEQSWISYKAVSLPQKQRAVRRMVNETDGFVPNYPMFEPFLKRSNISPNAPAVLCSQ
ncbi:MAG: SDR family NAD(P)-dependent oxidoreductase, partial [Deltaproteobacteria bacterium]|nr:SDR family NAD(P)-dependent oxidoreductase [Deltaproteobacteria bacterium]